MPLFGRKQPPSTAPRPDMLLVEREADVDWIKQSNDPLVWHDAALACLIFRGDRHGLIAWLVEQPALDRVTAAAMFLHRGNGARRARGEEVEFVHMEKAQVEAMIERLWQLDRALPDHGIGLASGWEQARLDTIGELAGLTPALPRFLREPIDRQTATMPYLDIGDGELASDAYWRREMPFLFD